MSKASELDKAYAAGVMDSDGSFGCYFSSGSMKVVMTVSVLDKRVPLFFQERWGGAIKTQTHSGSHARMLWRWETMGLKSATFVRDVLPYLVAKREQADLVVRLLSTITPGGCRVTEETKQQRAEWAEELSRLKWV